MAGEPLIVITVTEANYFSNESVSDSLSPILPDEEVEKSVTATRVCKTCRCENMWNIEQAIYANSEVSVT
jgi:hypothetical protein